MEKCQQKKRQRCNSWTDNEIERLVNLRLETLENLNRCGKGKNNELVWEA